jgi:hypothetical protein
VKDLVDLLLLIEQSKIVEIARLMFTIEALAERPK